MCVLNRGQVESLVQATVKSTVELRKWTVADDGVKYVSHPHLLTLRQGIVEQAVLQEQTGVLGQALERRPLPADGEQNGSHRSVALQIVHF